MFQKYTRNGSAASEATQPRPLIATDAPAAPAAEPAGQGQGLVSARHIALKVYLHEKLLSLLNLGVLDKITGDELRKELEPLVRTVLAGDGIALHTIEYHQLVDEVLDEVLGLG